MPAVNHNDEHLLTPVLLVALNVSMLISFYLGDEVYRALDGIRGGAEARHFLLLFVIAMVLSLLALKFRRRFLLVTSIASQFDQEIGTTTRSSTKSTLPPAAPKPGIDASGTSKVERMAISVDSPSNT